MRAKSRNKKNRLKAWKPGYGIEMYTCLGAHSKLEVVCIRLFASHSHREVSVIGNAASNNKFTLIDEFHIETANNLARLSTLDRLSRSR